jgi:hypothetical protein
MFLLPRIASQASDLALFPSFSFVRHDEKNAADDSFIPVK